MTNSFPPVEFCLFTGTLLIFPDFFNFFVHIRNYTVFRVTTRTNSMTAISELIIASAD